ncbi:unnamed protein product [Notodromas monacha]|uniref:Uncharacterized protein n=1 Tax=Notodromas monacha TaxID=399045 RepID=A0A7R9BJZ3_9CRUS|nr:unnamed protein product [Notodromas monacha]CAG0915374.1 unnamed protein product [Notodromas monacha]
MLAALDKWYGEQFNRAQVRIHLSNAYLRIFLGELLASVIVMSIGLGSTAQAVVSRELAFPNRTGTAQVPPPHPERSSSFPLAGDFVSVAAAWGVAYAFGVMVTGGVSGGFMNPALTLAMGLFARIRLSFVPVFWLAQYLGALIAAGVVGLVYKDALWAVDCQFDHNCERTLVTAEVFASFPRGVLIGQQMGSVLDVLVGSCLFGCLTFAMWDPRNLGARRELGAIFMGLAVIAIALSFGYNSGFPINPARDFAARLFAVMAGWGTGLFHYYDYYFWIPVVVPHIGCLLGALLYELYIGFHFPYWTFNNESGAAEIVHPDGELRDPPSPQHPPPTEPYFLRVLEKDGHGTTPRDDRSVTFLKPPPNTPFSAAGAESNRGADDAAGAPASYNRPTKSAASSAL